MARHRGPKKAPAQKKPPLTHFLCVPLISSTSRSLFEASLTEFRDAVSNSDQTAIEGVETGGETQQEAKLPVIHPKAIRPVGTLHLTLGVMSLDENKLSDAVEYLKDNDVRDLLERTVNESSDANETNQQVNLADGSSALERPITPPTVNRSGGPFKVYLKGVMSMHAAHKTSILYSAPVDESGRLYPFCVALQKLFKDKGFLVEDNRPLKLHATIVNTIYAKGKKRPAKHNAKQQTPGPSIKESTSTEQAEETATHFGSVEANDDRFAGHGPSANGPLSIDATAILKKYKDFVWAENIVLDRVAICEMGAKKIFNDEGKEIGAEYTEVGSIPLPS